MVYRLIYGDCLDKLKDLDNSSIDSMVTDPPAGIGFMGKNWDSKSTFNNQMDSIFEECLRVLKPGSHALVWAIPRTSHWTSTALEKSGFEIRDIITHLFGSGFPKSHNISKAMDKAAGAEREDLGPNPNRIGRSQDIRGDNLSPSIAMGLGKKCDAEKLTRLTKPASDEAKQWDGFGTALKPASEFWILVRKPLSENTIVKNVLKHGVGGINIDGCRVGTETIEKGRFPANLIFSHHEECELKGSKEVKAIKSGVTKSTDPKGWKNSSKEVAQYGHGKDGKETVEDWNCHDSCPIKALDEQSGIIKSGAPGIKRRCDTGILGEDSRPVGTQMRGFGDKGGASRFFKTFEPEYNHPFLYTSKASKKDRGKNNSHPTVKSTKLMAYLCKLITPPGGLILDPFTGSGSTGVAALKEGFQFIGIEVNEEYFEIARCRLDEVV